MAGVPGSHEPAGHILDALVTRLCIPRVPRVPGVTRLTIITDIRQFPSSSDPSQALQSDTLSAGEHSLLLVMMCTCHSLQDPAGCFETFILILLSTPTAVSDPEKPVSFQLIHLPLSRLCNVWSGIWYSLFSSHYTQQRGLKAAAPAPLLHLPLLHIVLAPEIFRGLTIDQTIQREK